MTDKREAILQRLETILKTIDGVKETVRNGTVTSGNKRPCIELYDGDEQRAVDPPNGRQGRGPMIISMTPEIYAQVSELAEEIGPAVNELRATIIKAIMTDEELLELAGQGAVVYEGCSNTLAKASKISGELSLAFSITYVLDPTKL